MSRGWWFTREKNDNFAAASVRKVTQSQKACSTLGGQPVIYSDAMRGERQVRDMKVRMNMLFRRV